MKPTLTPADLQSVKYLLEESGYNKEGGHKLFDHDLELVILSAMFEGFRPTAPLRAGDFFCHAHQVLFDTLELSFVHDVARTPELLAKGLRAANVAVTSEQILFLIESVIGTPFALHLDWAAERIIQLAKRRRALAWVYRLKILLENPETQNEQIEDAYRKLQELMP